MTGRWPTSENIWWRVSTSFTGRPSTRAAITATGTCDQAVPLHPKPPPTNSEITRTPSSGRPNSFAIRLRTPVIPWLPSWARISGGTSK